MYATLLSTKHATRSAHLILLGIFNRIKFVQQYRSLCCSFCSFLHSHVTSCLIVPNTLKHLQPTIIPFPNNAVLYTSTYYQSKSIHTQPTITVDTIPYNLKRCLFNVIFCNYKCLNIGLFPNNATFYAFIYNESK